MSRWFRSIVLVALLSAPGLARAQGASAASVATLTAERQKVRAGLDRVNAEIDALKHEKRGIREDYQLRARMADAEAMAQRLIDLDVRIERLNPRGGGRATPLVLAAPEARPLDDRAALEAKADILSDQAHRLESQAGLLAGRMTEVRGRQELRRRAGQLERDPFSPLEQSKRRIAAGAPMGPPGTKDLGGTASPGTTPGGFTPPPRGNEGAMGTGSPPSVTGGAAPATPGTTVSTDSARITTSGSLAQTAVPVGATDAPGSVAGQFRGVLDAATLAEIRRLEGVGSPGSNLQAMERALSALRQRAALLKASAADLRARAKTAP